MKNLIIVLCVLFFWGCARKGGPAPTSTTSSEPPTLAPAPSPDLSEVFTIESPLATGEASIATAEASLATSETTLAFVFVKNFHLGMTLESWVKTAREARKEGLGAAYHKRWSPYPDDPIEFFIYADKKDPSISEISFRFFKDRLSEINVLYSSRFLDGVILADFIEKLKLKFGEPSINYEEGRVPGRGETVWEDSLYSVTFKVIEGRPFSLELTHRNLMEEELEYFESEEKEHSRTKLEGITF